MRLRLTPERQGSEQSSLAFVGNLHFPHPAVGRIGRVPQQTVRHKRLKVAIEGRRVHSQEIGDEPDRQTVCSRKIGPLEIGQQAKLIDR